LVIQLPAGDRHLVHCIDGAQCLNARTLDLERCLCRSMLDTEESACRAYLVNGIPRLPMSPITSSNMESGQNQGPAKILMHARLFGIAARRQGAEGVEDK